MPHYAPPLLQLQLWAVHDAMGSTRRKLQAAERGVVQSGVENEQGGVGEADERDGEDAAGGGRERRSGLRRGVEEVTEEDYVTRIMI